MFHSMRNVALSGTSELLDQFTASLRAWAPESNVDAVTTPERRDFTAGDQVTWNIGRDSVRLLIDFNRPGANPAPEAATQRKRPGDIPIVVARYLSPTIRQRLADRGWSYWDSTGNASITCNDPFLMVHKDGAKRDPDPRRSSEPRVLQSLAGAASASVIVRLLTVGRADTLRTLATESGVGLGTASRVFGLLRNEGLVEAAGNPAVRVPDRTALARRWATDYSFFSANRASRFRSPLGRDGALAAFARTLPTESWGTTGLTAASNFFTARATPDALPASDLWIYAVNPVAAERAAMLSPDPAGDIAVGYGSFLESNPRTVLVGRESEPRVLPWRTVGDLLSAKGRHAAVGEELAAQLEAAN